MTSSTITPTLPDARTRLKVTAVHGSPALLSLIAMVVIFAVAVANQPGILSVPGLTLMLMSAVPLVLATQAQMLIMSVGDIDLGIGYLVGFVTVIAATVLQSSPLLGILILGVIVIAYAALGAIIQKRNVPSIIVTLGMSFVWLGLGLQFLPTPGGEAPAWLAAIGRWRPDWVPAPLVFILVATLLGWLIARRSRLGTRMRALGSSPATLEKLGWSLTRTRVLTYVIAAALIIAAGLMLASQTRSGDINSASNFTLMTIAAVILGGGNFSGGRALPLGATLGAVTLGLITVLLSLINLSSSLQSAAQGLIVLAVLAGRVITERAIRS
ncbi:ABC transporter permease [Mycetocola miduiensis]|uniref:Monosaccharide ABC transporter membrane protein, CUT2 family n=1 Tax=Mycetocola miduiensis TaxID=995034 RepID=A0A1I5C238_9MICO|nr:ABC transporter permease [Mycetocola miduiensis]SFN80721.1 monosaccharide ABC transporter membrane protein, CUT2 family [Mycetocola miduiensis]